jgi:hypothetical protein
MLRRLEPPEHSLILNNAVQHHYLNLELNGRNFFNYVAMQVTLSEITIDNSCLMSIFKSLILLQSHIHNMPAAQ